MKRFMSSLLRLPPEKCMEVTLQEEQFFTCELQLPMMPLKELAEAVRWELPLHVPFEEGSYIYNYQPLGKGEGLQRVKVFAVRKELVAEYEALAKSKGLTLTALRSGEEEAFNLLPDAEKRLRQPLSRFYKLGTTLAFLAGALLLAGSYCYHEAQLAKLNTAEQRLQEMKIWQQRFEEKQAREQKLATLSDALKKLERERLVWSRLLANLGNSMPKDCWLTLVKQRDESPVVEVQGKAGSMEQVKLLLRNLQGSRNFKQVSLTETGEGKNGLVNYRLLLEEKREGK